jgi:hypothetical protein
MTCSISRAQLDSVQHISADDLSDRSFAGRPDGMRLPSHSEELLIATT